MSPVDALHGTLVGLPLVDAAGPAVRPGAVRVKVPDPHRPGCFFDVTRSGGARVKRLSCGVTREKKAADPARTHRSADAVANLLPSVENATLRMYERCEWRRCEDEAAIFSCLMGLLPLPPGGAGVPSPPAALFVGMKATMVSKSGPPRVSRSCNNARCLVLPPPDPPVCSCLSACPRAS